MKTVDTYYFNSNEPINIIDDLSHHKIDNWHLWIGIEKGVVTVLNEEEQNFFTMLSKDISLASMLAYITKDYNNKSFIINKWKDIQSFISKLASDGFIKNIEGYYDIRRLSPEKFARLHLTKRCQLQCTHCYASSGPNIKSKNELSKSQWKKIILDISTNGGKSVLFTGGEPLLRNDCTELMCYSKNKGLNNTLFTNGLLVKNKLSELKECVDLVQVSLNGIDENINDKIRGKGTFQKVISAVELLAKSDVKVRIGITVMEQNWKSLKEGFANFVDQFKGTSVRFHLGNGLCHYGRANNLDDNLDQEDIRLQIDSLRSMANQYNGQRITRKTISCGYCEQLVIASDGRVYPCHLLDHPLGHYEDCSLNNWYEKLQKIAMENAVFNVVKCQNCDLKNLCGGTCRVINEKTTGNRLITTCTTEERDARYRNLISLFKDRKTNTLLFS